MNPTLLPLLLLQAAGAPSDAEADGLLLMVVGMGIVFLALFIIGELLNVLGRLLPDVEQVDEQALAAPPPAAGVDARTLAILTAAAYAAVGRPVQIRRVTFINQNTVSAWAEAGRRSVQTSHNVRRTR